MIKSDAIFINGGAGDFISGGHITQDLRNNINVKDLKLRQNNVLDQILKKHFSLWGNLKKNENISIIKKIFVMNLANHIFHLGIH